MTGNQYFKLLGVQSSKLHTLCCRTFGDAAYQPEFTDKMMALVRETIDRAILRSGGTHPTGKKASPGPLRLSRGRIEDFDPETGTFTFIRPGRNPS